MKKNKWYWSLIVISLVMLISLTAGCVTISDKKPDTPKKKSVLSPPVINSFVVDRDTITQGEQAKLSWDVSGTTTVTISPVVGPMEPVSTVLVTPETTITYTLSATNEAGTSTATVQVNVTPVVVSKPALVITEVWIEVKSRIEWGSTFSISRNQVLHALNVRDQFRLALVRVSGDGPAGDDVRYIADPFNGVEPALLADFNVEGLTLNFDEWWSRGAAPF